MTSEAACWRQSQNGLVDVVFERLGSIHILSCCIDLIRHFHQYLACFILPNHTRSIAYVSQFDAIALAAQLASGLISLSARFKVRTDGFLALGCNQHQRAKTNQREIRAGYLCFLCHFFQIKDQAFLMLQRCRKPIDPILQFREHLVADI